jgi:hypothetical protein
MVKVCLGNLMREGLERRKVDDLEVAVCAAVAEFTRRIERGDLVLAPPDFVPLSLTQVEELELRLEPAVEAIMRSEAARLRTSVDRLVTHAVMIKLAEIDSLESIFSPT